MKKVQCLERQSIFFIFSVDVQVGELEEKVRAYLQDMSETMPSFRDVDTNGRLDLGVQLGAVSKITVTDQHGRKRTIEVDIAEIMRKY